MKESQRELSEELRNSDFPEVAGLRDLVEGFAQVVVPDTIWALATVSGDDGQPNVGGQKVEYQEHSYATAEAAAAAAAAFCKISEESSDSEEEEDLEWDMDRREKPKPGLILQQDRYTPQCFLMAFSMRDIKADGPLMSKLTDHVYYLLDVETDEGQCANPDAGWDSVAYADIESAAKGARDLWGLEDIAERKGSDNEFRDDTDKPAKCMRKGQEGIVISSYCRSIRIHKLLLPRTPVDNSDEERAKLEAKQAAMASASVVWSLDALRRDGKIDEDGGLIESAFGGRKDLPPNLTLPVGIKYIHRCAFFGCSHLVSVVLPEGVTEIGDHAFENCTRLQSVTLPEGVATIGTECFSDCKRLSSINLPKGVKYIGCSAFCGCKKLASISLPEGLTEIKSHAFHGCSSLSSIQIPKGVTEIQQYTFRNCTALTNITFPLALTSIGSSAFHNCSSLVSVTCPNTLAAIQPHAFCGCTSLSHFDFPEAATIDETVFHGCSKLPFLTKKNCDFCIEIVY